MTIDRRKSVKCYPNSTLLEPAPDLYLFNMTWDDIWDTFDVEHPFLNSIELDMYGNPVPEQFTRLFRDITWFGEDNTW